MKSTQGGSSGSITATASPLSSKKRDHSTAIEALPIYVKDQQQQPPMVVILGATGTGKTKLSLDIATRLAGAEIINSDKMQFYHGLDICTNKQPLSKRRGVPHHLLGELDPADGEFDAAGFRSAASLVVDTIHAGGGIPILAGGSNSYVHALLADEFDPLRSPFTSQPDPFTRLRYMCCLLWVDVHGDVLDGWLDKRVDEMLDLGLVKELAEHYREERAIKERYEGLDLSIGVPEFDRFFRKCPPTEGAAGEVREGVTEALEEAVRKMKENTRKLAKRQVEKIRRLREIGWEIVRLDATEAIRGMLEEKGKDEVNERWSRDVMTRAMVEVEKLVNGNNGCSSVDGGGGQKRSKSTESVSTSSVEGSVALQTITS